MSSYSLSANLNGTVVVFIWSNKLLIITIHWSLFVAVCWKKEHKSNASYHQPHNHIAKFPEKILKIVVRGVFVASVFWWTIDNIYSSDWRRFDPCMHTWVTTSNASNTQSIRRIRCCHSSVHAWVKQLYSYRRQDEKCFSACVKVMAFLPNIWWSIKQTQTYLLT